MRHTKYKTDVKGDLPDTSVVHPWLLDKDEAITQATILVKNYPVVVKVSEVIFQDRDVISERLILDSSDD